MKVKKIVWIAYFSSEELRRGIHLKKKMDSFAPWIPAAINVFYGNPEYEIHIITPHYYVGTTKNFSDKNIHYHTFCQGIPFIGYGWPKWFALDRWTHYFNLKYFGLKILRNINPDIIHFWGAENTFASIYYGLTKDEKNKTIVSVQGFVLKDKQNLIRYTMQNWIFKQNRFFFITCDWMINKIKELNHNAEFYPLIYPINLPKYDKTIQKKYDLLFYARVTKSKGIEDLFEALKILKNENIELSLLIMGPCHSDYQRKLKEKADQLGVSNQITWAGFIDTQESLYIKAQEAKIYVLPTHNDILASTIRESMAMQIPVITYSTGCIPVLNKPDENIIIVPVGKIDELARNIKELILDEDKQVNLKNKAQEFILKLNSEDSFKKNLETGYNQILNSK